MGPSPRVKPQRRVPLGCVASGVARGGPCQPGPPGGGPRGAGGGPGAGPEVAGREGGAGAGAGRRGGAASVSWSPTPPPPPLLASLPPPCAVRGAPSSLGMSVPADLARRRLSPDSPPSNNSSVGILLGQWVKILGGGGYFFGFLRPNTNALNTPPLFPNQSPFVPDGWLFCSKNWLCRKSVNCCVLLVAGVS